MREYKSVQAYHGSTVNFEKFDNAHLQARDEGYWGVGFYLGTIDTAYQAVKFSQSGKGFIHSCYVAGEFFVIENEISDVLVKLLQDYEIEYHEDYLVAGEQWETYLSDVVDIEKLTKVLKAQGYKGIYADTSIHGLHIVVFDGDDIEIFNTEEA